jgi:hypothetical protein
VVDPVPSSEERITHVHGANDNPLPGEACVTDAGAPLPYPTITDEELALLQPLIEALARMAARRVSATTLSSDPQVRRCA